MSAATAGSERPRGHARSVVGLWRAARSSRLPHALLFWGPSGIGKFKSAAWLVQGLLCERGIPEQEGPCGSCGACKRFLSGNHLDAMVLDPIEEEREQIPVHWIAVRSDEGKPPQDKGRPAVEEFVALRAADGGWRAVIVRDAERMNPTAQNAALKMLEEPAPRTLWILSTARPGELLSTVRSRCIPVHFDALEAEDVEAVLADLGLASDAARAVARWSGGSPGDAAALARKAAPRMREIACTVLDGRSAPLDAAREVWELEGDFEGHTPSARDRDRARTFLDLALGLVADRHRHALGANAAQLAHGDSCSVSATEGSASGGAARARAALDALLVARGDIDQNLDPKAAVDRALLAIARPSR